MTGPGQKCEHGSCATSRRASDAKGDHSCWSVCSKPARHGAGATWLMTSMTPDDSIGVQKAVAAAIIALVAQPISRSPQLAHCPP